jgi:hypothetical protein
VAGIGMAVCMPKACISTAAFGAGFVCTGCQPGYSITPNNSCILNFVNQADLTNNALTINPA